MEKFLNKLLKNPDLLEDHKLNAKIEKLFDNSFFQRMVETTDVLEDVSHISVPDSLQKNLNRYKGKNF